MSQEPWPLRELEPTGLQVGPCAWSVRACTTKNEGYLNKRPSMIVAGASDPVEVLADVAPIIQRLTESCSSSIPIMMGIQEPEFTRRFEQLVQQRFDALGIKSVDVLTIWVDDVQDLKSGGILQTAFELRQAGLTKHVGLAHHDARCVEWLAKNSAVHVLVLPYHINNQLARYRAISAAKEYGMVCVSMLQEQPDQLAARFALGESERALPIFDTPLPAELMPMSQEDVDECWKAYQESHAEPDPLDRGRPPQA